MEIFGGTDAFQVINRKEGLILLVKICTTALPCLNSMREQPTLKGAYIGHIVFY